MRIETLNHTHLPFLIEYLNRSEGDVLEMGIGLGSTIVLHEFCRNRHLVSYENVLPMVRKFKKMSADWHELIHIEDYKQASIEKSWGLAFIDFDPIIERSDAAIRLAPWADYVVLHDTEIKNNRRFGIRKCYEHFRYRKSFKDYVPHTTVLSNKWQP